VAYPGVVLAQTAYGHRSWLLDERQFRLRKTTRKKYGLLTLPNQSPFSELNELQFPNVKILQ